MLQIFVVFLKYRLESGLGVLPTMKGRIEELIEQKLKKEFLSDVETRQNQDSDSDEEMSSVIRFYRSYPCFR